MTTPPTETQLLQLLAKMLPEILLLKWYSDEDTPYFFIYWKDSGCKLKTTEYLEICRMVEEGLSEEQWLHYIVELEHQTPVYTLVGIIFNAIHAPYFQRIQALAIVKGVEIE